jgi:asparagine synthase (glutamine-hydrolysing)
MRIPSSRKLSGGDTKTGLKESFGDLIPETVKNRDKMGFGVPLKSWFRDNPEARYLTDVLMAQESGFFSIIDRYELEQLIEQHRSGKRDVSALLWALVVMKLWMKEFNVRI